MLKSANEVMFALETSDHCANVQLMQAYRGGVTGATPRMLSTGRSATVPRIVAIDPCLSPSPCHFSISRAFFSFSFSDSAILHFLQVYKKLFDDNDWRHS